MKISSRCDYACRALAELAFHSGEKRPLQISVIASHQDIPEKYLVHILNLLRRNGLVASRRGKQGGYSLAKEPSEITLGDVIRQVDGPLISTLCVDETTKKKCPQAVHCPFRVIWKEVDEAMSKVLDEVTFEDIAARMNAPSERPMYYI
jgi:Rrf2 family protein